MVLQGYRCSVASEFRGFYLDGQGETLLRCEGGGEADQQRRRWSLYFHTEVNTYGCFQWVVAQLIVIEVGAEKVEPQW